MTKIAGFQKSAEGTRVTGQSSHTNGKKEEKEVPFKTSKLYKCLIVMLYI